MRLFQFVKKAHVGTNCFHAARTFRYQTVNLVLSIRWVLRLYDYETIDELQFSLMKISLNFRVHVLFALRCIFPKDLEPMLNLKETSNSNLNYLPQWGYDVIIVEQAYLDLKFQDLLYMAIFGIIPWKIVRGMTMCPFFDVSQHVSNGLLWQPKWTLGNAKQLKCLIGVDWLSHQASLPPSSIVIA